MAVINGNDLVIKSITTGSSDTKIVFAHSQSVTLSFSNSTIETTTKDSNSWMEQITGKKSFTLSADGLIDYGTVTDAHNFEAFADLAIAGTAVDFTFGDGTNSYDGTAFIDSFDANGGTDDVATYSISLTGTGSLTKT